MAIIDADELPTFEYSPLAANEIRLLSPIPSSDGYSWKLQTVNLDAPHLEFDALSYTWGTQRETHPVLCNSQLLHVHHNLWTALPFLAQRLTGGSRMIWVDAVCINQSDDVEKAVQIKLMNSLYRRAKQVCVWLGFPDSPEVQAQMPRAIALLPHITEESKRRDELGIGWKTDDVGPPLQNLDANIWAAIVFLLRNPWYYRVWIVQEAALASDITFLCGACEIDAKILETAIEHDRLGTWKVVDSNEENVRLGSSPMDCSTVFWIRELVSERDTSHLKLGTAGLMLRVTLLMTADHACWLPQDRVLGMLGLIRQHELAGTGIDVGADVTFQTLYTQFTTWLLLGNDPYETQFWWPLFDHAVAFKKAEGLPSWVPDYHHQNKDEGDVCMMRKIVDAVPKQRRYQASGNTIKVRVGSRMGNIVLQGKIVDEVVVVHPEVPHRPDVDDKGEAATAWMAKLARWEEGIGRRILEDENDKTDDQGQGFRRISENTYWETLCMHYFVDAASGAEITKESRSAFRPVMTQVRTWCEWKLENLEREAAGLEELPPVMDEAVLRQIMAETPTHNIITKMMFLVDRQLFNTKNCYFGLVIKGVQPGDLVCVFNTATTPHVLRKVPGEDGDVYQVIGDAYVSNLMYGQADDLSDDVRDITLV